MTEALHDQIRELPSVGYAPNASIVDSLLRAKWAESDDLAEGFNVLEKGEPNRVIFYAQLPFELRLPPKWIELSAELGNPWMFVRTIGTSVKPISPQSPFSVTGRHRIVDSESFTNARLPFDPYGLLTRTQVLISFKLWEYRRAYYAKYLKTLHHESLMREVLVPPARSWFRSRRAVTAQMYEHDLLNPQSDR